MKIARGILGTDALEKIHKKPDIILLDINMPKI